MQLQSQQNTINTDQNKPIISTLRTSGVGVFQDCPYPDVLRRVERYGLQKKEKAINPPQMSFIVCWYEKSPRTTKVSLPKSEERKTSAFF